MNDFDYGAEVPENRYCYKRWPEDGEFTALVDADRIPYVVGYTTDETDAVIAYKQAMAICDIDPLLYPDYTETQEWYEALLKTKQFKNAVDQADWLVNHSVEVADADSAILFMTTRGAQFRESIAFSKKYKGQRSEDKPPFFHEIRTHLLTAHGARLSEFCEADDEISIEQWRRHHLFEETCGHANVIGTDMHKAFSDCCVVSSDKDLMIIPGWHANPDRDEKRAWVPVLGWLQPKYKDKEVADYEHWPLKDGKAVPPDSFEGEPDKFKRGAKAGQVKTKRVKVGTIKTQYIDSLKGAGLKFFYSQMITGDTVDNYPGLPSKGATAAFEALDGCQSEEELSDAVYGMYLEKYGYAPFNTITWDGRTKEVDARDMYLEQGRLAWMQTKKGEIWREEESSDFCKEV